MLTAEELRALLDYDPETGLFTRRTNTGTAKVGDRAGYLTGDIRHKIVAISVGNKSFKAHRLAWLHHYGKWPNGGIDHVDRDPTNNAISNLREATQLQNMANLGPCSGSTPWNGRFRSQIRINGKNIHLGMFDTPEEATMAYRNAAAKRLASAFPS
jgi:HNH endonuclease